MKTAAGEHEASGKIGACSWSLKVISPRLLVEALDMTGLKAVQLALMPLVQEPRIWTNTFSILKDAGIEVLSGMFAAVGEDYTTLESIRRTGGVRPDAMWPETLEHAIRVADLAIERELKLVTLHAGFIPHEADDPVRAVVLDRLRTVADLFAERGIFVALETGQETATTLLSALEELDRPNVGVNFDPANMILYGMGDPVEALGMLAPHVVQVHIKDAVAAEEKGLWGTEVPVGEGQVDWVAFLKAVDSLPRSVDLLIEREAGEHRVSDIAHARGFLASLGAKQSGVEGSAT
jgi:sugar phosphate isomerase/epimerase